MTPPKHLLVATDFTDASKEALDYAIDFARAIGAKVTLAHVYEVPTFAYQGGLVSMPIGLATELGQAANETMNRLRASLSSSDVAIESVVREGPPSATLRAIADEIGADVIVVGTHGRRGLSRMVLGSVAEDVIRGATRPVLAVRAKHA